MYNEQKENKPPHLKSRPHKTKGRRSYRHVHSYPSLNQIPIVELRQHKNWTPNFNKYKVPEVLKSTVTCSRTSQWRMRFNYKIYEDGFLFKKKSLELSIGDSYKHIYLKMSILCSLFHVYSYNLYNFLLNLSQTVLFNDNKILNLNLNLVLKNKQHW